MSYGVDLSGRNALVTGGSRGIGRAIALALGGCGAAVAVNFRARAAEADAVVERYAQPAGARSPSRRRVGRRRGGGARRARRPRLGAIDVWSTTPDRARGCGRGGFDRTLATNLKSAWLCTEAVLPGMRARRWGRIVNMSSIAARGAGAIGVAYNASKAGLEGLTRGYAARVAQDGVTVNAIAPGTDRHRDGRAAQGRAASSRAFPWAAWASRRGGAGDNAGRRQRLHDRTDDRGERRPGVSLARCGRVAQAERAARESGRSRPHAGEGFHIS